MEDKNATNNKVLAESLEKVMASGKATVDPSEVQAEVTHLTELERAQVALAMAETEAKTCRERVKNALPFATDEQAQVVIDCTRTQRPAPDGHKPNVDFVLTDLQKGRVKKARDERKAEVATDEYHAKTLRSLKKETITSDIVRWDRHGGYSRNLRTERSAKSIMAELRKKLAEKEERIAELEGAKA